MKRTNYTTRRLETTLPFGEQKKWEDQYETYGGFGCACGDGGRTTNEKCTSAPCTPLKKKSSRSVLPFGDRKL